jgi:hypothetical protein
VGVALTKPPYDRSVRPGAMRWAVAGPMAFGGGAWAAGRRVPGYSHADEPISALAASSMPAARLMISGFLGLGVSTVALAASIRDELHGAASIATFLIWAAAPPVAARRAEAAPPGFRRASTALGAGSLAALGIGGAIAARGTRGVGAAQRGMAACAFSWFVLAARD